MMEAEFNAELQCSPMRMNYDFVRRVGTLNMMRNDRCDMAGCIALFERIDPKVERITTYSGADRTIYARLAGGWQAVTKDQAP
jgi:hypothetical protein